MGEKVRAKVTYSGIVEDVAIVGSLAANMLVNCLPRQIRALVASRGRKNETEVRKMAESIPIDPEEIPTTVKPSIGEKLLRKFLTSNGRAAHVELNEDKTTNSIVWSLRKAVKRGNAKVVVKTVKGNIYLQRS